MILDDAALVEAPREIIRERRCNAEWALVQQMDELTAAFDDIEDPYLREREDDVRQVAERVLKALMGAQPAAPKPARGGAGADRGGARPLARRRDPLQRHPFAGFVTDLGGATSHTAIVARSLNIPAIVGLHHARHMIREDELLIVDGTQGVVIVNPDPHVLAEYRLKQTQLGSSASKLKRLKTHAGGDPRRHADPALRQHRAAAGRGAGAGERRHGRGPLPQRVPVHEPPRPARRGRAVRGLPRGGRRR